MTKKVIYIILVLMISLVLAACSSDSNDVPSLAATPTPGAAGESLDIEAKMMEFAECLRGEGMEITDPMVDSDGNIQKPQLVAGATASKEEWIAAYEVCGEIIENITFEKKEFDRSAQVDQYVELAACLREQGFDIGEPTTETLDTWLADLKTGIDWDDPDAQAAYETCTGGSMNSVDKGGGK